MHNRLSRYLKKAREVQDPATGLVRDAFVECPPIFFQGLSKEEFRAKQELYRAAFEMARRQGGQPADFNLGDGI